MPINWLTAICVMAFAEGQMLIDFSTSEEGESRVKPGLRPGLEGP